MGIRQGYSPLSSAKAPAMAPPALRKLRRFIKDLLYDFLMNSRKTYFASQGRGELRIRENLFDSAPQGKLGHRSRGIAPRLFTAG
jgi:hypothetical protein